MDEHCQALDSTLLQSTLYFITLKYVYEVMKIEQSFLVHHFQKEKWIPFTFKTEKFVKLKFCVIHFMLKDTI